MVILDSFFLLLIIHSFASLGISCSLLLCFPSYEAKPPRPENLLLFCALFMKASEWQPSWKISPTSHTRVLSFFHLLTKIMYPLELGSNNMEVPYILNGEIGTFPSPYDCWLAIFFSYNNASRQNEIKGDFTLIFFFRIIALCLRYPSDIN